ASPRQRPRRMRRSRGPLLKSTSARATPTSRLRACGTTASSARRIPAGCWGLRSRLRAMRPWAARTLVCSAC
ncbi:hypothetical protein H4S07_002586, partial [Coemansia furcata]